MNLQQKQIQGRHRLAEQEMALYDSMHPVVRKVLQEHAVGIYLVNLFKNKPAAYHFALNHPNEFSVSLAELLDRTQENIEKMKRTGKL